MGLKRSVSGHLHRRLPAWWRGSNDSWKTTAGSNDSNSSLVNGQLAVDLVYNLGRADEPDLWSVELISQLVLGDSVDLWNVELISQLVLGRRGIRLSDF